MPDRRAVPLIPPRTSVTLVLVRHGESTWVAEGRVQGSANPPLSGLGGQQAALVGARLADPHAPPPLPIPPGRPLGIWHSPLQRAKQTAQPIADGWQPSLALHPDARLQEISQGDWEGLTAADLEAQYGALLAGWRRDPVHFHAPRGEALMDVDQRVRACVSDLLAEQFGEGRLAYHASGDAHPDHEPKHGPEGPWAPPWAILVAHDGVLRVLLLALLDLPLAAFWRLPLGLCAISVVEIRAGRPALRVHNLETHLAPVAGSVAALEGPDRGGAL